MAGLVALAVLAPIVGSVALGFGPPEFLAIALFGALVLSRIGGSLGNVALGLSRLGESTDLLTHIAADDDGSLIARHLFESGVRVLPGSFTADRTPTTLVIVRPDGSARYEFTVS